MPDHVHMLLAIPPKYSVSSVMGYLKGKRDVYKRQAGFCALANLMLMLPIVVLYFAASDFIRCV